MAEDFDPLADREQADEQIRESQLLESLNEEEQLAVFVALLGDERVRDLLWEIMNWCGIFLDPMHSNFGHVAYGLGKAAIGKRLLLKINEAAPQAWRLMQEKAAFLAAQQAKTRRSPKPRGRQATPSA